MNDFEPDDMRPMEIHEAWVKFGCPPTFQEFRALLTGKGRATNPLNPSSESTEPSAPKPSTPADQPDGLTGALSKKFGLPATALNAFSAKAVARAEGLSGLPKSKPVARKYKPLKGAAKEEVSALIDEALKSLLQLSQKHGTDPTAATKLFQKNLDYFTSSLWHMWEMSNAVDRATKGSENAEDSEDEDADGDEGREVHQSGNDDDTSGSNEVDGSQSRSFFHSNQTTSMSLMQYLSCRSVWEQGDTGQGGCGSVQRGENSCHCCWS